MAERESDDLSITEERPTFDGQARAETLPGTTLQWQTVDDKSDVEVVAIDAPVLDEMTFEARYEEVSVLGEGGMGVVTSCSDRQIGRRVAMKRLLPARMTSVEARARFLHEARVQGQLEHPAIVPVYDLGVDPDRSLYFTMKRIRGTTLSDIIANVVSHGTTTDGWSRRKLLTAFSQVCLAVDFAHERGVLHRDLKPGNLMFGDYGEVYILDWGLARLRAGIDVDIDTALELPNELSLTPTAPGTLLGTIGYMSPEQLNGAHDTLGPPSDVYALGAILFEILTLEPLHRGTTAMEVYESNLRGADARASRRAPHEEIPPELDSVVVRATAPVPDNRFATARELHQAIERFLDGERDLELRSHLCLRHTIAATKALERARTNEGPHFEQRRRAMQEVGKALALDPANPEAMELMVRILNEPAKRLPREVEIEMARVEQGNLRWMGKVGGYAYLSLLLYLPFLLWCGVRSWGWPIVFYVSAIAASVVSFWVGRQQKPSQSFALGVLLLSNLAFAATGAFFGPFIVTPALLAVNATGFALNLNVMHRSVALASGCLFVVLVVVASLAGIFPGGYAFDAKGMTVLPGAIELPRTATLVFLSAVAVGSVITGTLSVTRVRNKLAGAERQLYLYAWHLREMVPEAVRGPTDPTVAKTSAFRRR